MLKITGQNFGGSNKLALQIGHMVKTIASEASTLDNFENRFTEEVQKINTGTNVKAELSYKAFRVTDNELHVCKIDSRGNRKVIYKVELN